MKSLGQILIAACTLGCFQGAQASVLALNYGQSNQAKQGNVDGKGYDIEDFSSRFTTYSGSIFMSEAFGVSGYLEQNDEKEISGFMGSMRASTHSVEWERGWLKGDLTFNGIQTDYRNEFTRIGLFEHSEEAEGLEVGLVYYRKTKPTVVKADGRSAANAFMEDEEWLDPKMKYELYGFHLRYDSVRHTLDKLVRAGKSGSSADWYFSFSHIQGVGRIRTSKSIGKPQSQDHYEGDKEWWGFLAAEGRYQFGLAYIKAGPGWAFALDAGVFADVSLPLGIHKDLFTKDKNIPEQKRIGTGWEARAGFVF